jgi:hypothetical protein
MNWQQVQNGRKLSLVYLHCGTGDQLQEQDRSMHRFRKEQGVTCEYLETAGKQDWPFWKSASAGMIDFQ